MKDHAKVSALFKQFQASKNATEKFDIVDKLVKELSQHAAVEEQYLYPMIRNTFKDSTGARWADRSLDEHQTVKILLAKLEAMKATDAQYDSTVQELMRNVTAHVQEEENEIFPALRAKLTQQELSTLEDALDKGKSLAPTHAHPMAPNQPPMNFLNAAVAAADIVRDTVTGRKVWSK